ncbi:phage head closure protein [Furfurilactobacillus entadae]|uniref:phage head closure protein n=1 Tax=Furfurilactobacillus entadae TaxID=2922307 RepID=UPI0035E86D6E
MSIAESGELTHHIKIIKQSNSTERDEYGDFVPTEKEVTRMWAKQRSLTANEVAANISTLSEQVQFVIRHRFSDQIEITTDMQVSDNEKVYEIVDYNSDESYGKWDVIICKRRKSGNQDVV